MLSSTFAANIHPYQWHLGTSPHRYDDYAITAACHCAWTDCSLARACLLYLFVLDWLCVLADRPYSAPWLYCLLAREAPL